ncbi:MAG: UDP-N-acetylmuramoyl-tripeptide--D-alanyl-D-alanine ligase [Candidatus Dojkabacteria bacterium]|nr:UDP-N-acetylmuramoyl-tripeptide--D-alanyl-D-alanine ligase [Candidatus Dojkabacteria bacterium]
MNVPLSEIKENIPEFEILNYEDLSITGVSYDSRTVEPGDIFFPIKGENFDGHDFIPEAFEKGAIISLCDSSHLSNLVDLKKPLIVVDSIEEGLEKVVNILFSKILAPKVAITGSTGKTTTREMLVKILKDKGSVLSTDSNINTLWGNAKLLSKYNNEEYIVLEMGMDRAGEIGWQCRAIEPDLGVILNIGYVHAENVGGIENVFNAKKDLADYLHRSGKPLVLNSDDEWLKKIEKNYTYQLLTYGVEGSDFRLVDSHVSMEGTEFLFVYKGAEYNCKIKAYGKGLAYNALAAISLAELLGIEVIDSIKSLEEYNGFSGRFEIKDFKDGIKIVNDAYNANPTSMKMSIETFNDIFAEDKYERVVILGDMKELGDVSADQHKLLGELVKSKGFDKVYYIGDFYNDFGVGEQLKSWEDAKKIIDDLNVKSKDIAILLKASHSIGLYNIVE